MKYGGRIVSKSHFFLQRVFGVSIHDGCRWDEMEAILQDSLLYLVYVTLRSS